MDTMAVKNNWEHLTGCDWAQLLQFQPEIENRRVRFSRSFGSISCRHNMKCACYGMEREVILIRKPKPRCRNGRRPGLKIHGPKGVGVRLPPGAPSIVGDI